MTDLERFIDLYKSVGIELKVDVLENVRLAPYSDARGQVQHIDLEDAQHEGKFNGNYSTWIVFDLQGKFLYQMAGC